MDTNEHRSDDDSCLDLCSSVSICGSIFWSRSQATLGIHSAGWRRIRREIASIASYSTVADRRKENNPAALGSRVADVSTVGIVAGGHHGEEGSPM
jgi:hypothetical protein